MGANPEHDCAQRNGRAPHGQLYDVTCTGPRGAERGILLFAVVCDFGRKWATLKVCILQFAFIGTGDSGYLLFTTLGESISSSDLCVEDFLAMNNKPARSWSVRVVQERDHQRTNRNVNRTRYSKVR